MTKKHLHLSAIQVFVMFSALDPALDTSWNLKKLFPTGSFHMIWVCQLYVWQYEHYVGKVLAYQMSNPKWVKPVLAKTPYLTGETVTTATTTALTLRLREFLVIQHPQLQYGTTYLMVKHLLYFHRKMGYSTPAPYAVLHVPPLQSVQDHQRVWRMPRMRTVTKAMIPTATWPPFSQLL